MGFVVSKLLVPPIPLQTLRKSSLLTSFIGFLEVHKCLRKLLELLVFIFVFEHLLLKFYSHIHFSEIEFIRILLEDVSEVV